MLDLRGNTDKLSHHLYRKSGQCCCEILRVTHAQTETVPQLCHCGIQLHVSFTPDLQGIDVSVVYSEPT